MKCPNCNKKIENDSVFCEYCGAKVRKNGTVTILGYVESFAFNPSVAIYKDGIQIGKVARNEKIELNISQQCELQFKCSFRSAKCVVQIGDWILLSFDRTTGQLKATMTNQYNAQNSIEQTKKNNGKFWFWYFFMIILSGILYVVSML